MLYGNRTNLWCQLRQNGVHYTQYFSSLTQTLKLKTSQINCDNNIRLLLAYQNNYFSQKFFFQLSGLTI
jgi:hypothetical protein